MLKIFRKKNVRQITLWVVSILIILSFGVFGTATYLIDSEQTRYVGEVFGKKIKITDFRDYYAETLDQALLVHGDNLETLRPFLNFQSETWDRIMLVTEAKNRKLKVADDELVNYLQQIASFHRNDAFNQQLYNDILQYVFKRKAREFEEGIRSHLLITKLFDQETLGLMVNEDEIKDQYAKRNEQSKVSYTLINPNDYKEEIVIADEETQSYYNQNKDKFLAPPSVNVEYIIFPTGEEMMDAQKEALGDIVYQIYEELAANKNPDLTTAAAKSGDKEVYTSGFFSLEEPRLDLGWSFEHMQQIFQLQINEITEPLETPQGFMILKLKETRPSYVPEFAEVKDKVTDALTQSKLQARALEAAQGIFDNIKMQLDASSEATFTSVLEGLAREVKQTPLFARGGYIEGIGLSPEFQNTAFNLNKDNPLSEPVALSTGIAIMYLDEFVGVDEEKFEEEKQEFENQILEQKRQEHLRGFITNLRQISGLRDDMEEGTFK